MPTADFNLALRDAARHGDDAEVNALLARGAEVDAASGDGFTPLIAAAQKGHEGTVCLLLARGADPHGRNRFGKSALDYAVEGGDLDAARALLAAGADANGRTKVYISSYPLVCVAARDLSLPMAALLLDHGADVDERIRLLEGVEFDYDPDHGNDGKTALILAAGKKFVGPAAEMVTLLLERGASVNAVGTSTWTALMEAASAGNAAAVRSLLTHGSDATARSRDGRTAQAIAEDFGRPQVADLLRAADGEGGR